MELNQSIRNIERPARIARLPISPRGYPVPWFVSWIDGEPDFVHIEPEKVVTAAKKHLCWICGGRLGRHLAFSIGPMCAVNRVSAEPPAHRDCAEYAVKACPFLSRPKMRRNDKDEPEDRFVPGIALLHNPGVALVWITHGFKPVSDGRGGTLFQIGRPVDVSFYCEGRKATREEVLAAINKGLPVLQDMAEVDGPEAVAELQQVVRTAMELVPA